MVTDLDEVYRLGTAKAEENLAFRRYLSAHHADDKRFQIIATDIQQHVDCTVCANCCRHSVVSISRPELEAIARQVGVTEEAATQLYTVADPEAPALRILRAEAGACVFLHDNRCTVYQARPKACREFPHVTVGSHSLGGRPASLARWAALCPIIYNGLEEYKHITGYHGHQPSE